MLVTIYQSAQLNIPEDLECEFSVFFAGVLLECERCDEIYIKQNRNKFLSEMGGR
jgi:hypothetical protein